MRPSRSSRIDMPHVWLRPSHESGFRQLRVCSARTHSGDNFVAQQPPPLRPAPLPVKSPLGSADVAQLVEQLIRNQ